jgi:hypothetical protein
MTNILITYFLVSITEITYLDHRPIWRTSEIRHYDGVKLQHGILLVDDTNQPDDGDQNSVAYFPNLRFGMSAVEVKDALGGSLRISPKVIEGIQFNEVVADTNWNARCAARRKRGHKCIPVRRGNGVANGLWEVYAVNRGDCDEVSYEKLKSIFSQKFSLYIEEETLGDEPPYDKYIDFQDERTKSIIELSSECEEGGSKLEINIR